MYRDNTARIDNYYPEHSFYNRNSAVTMPAKPKKEKTSRPIPMPKPKRRKKASIGLLICKVFILSILFTLAYFMVPFSVHAINSTYNKTNIKTKAETVNASSLLCF